MTAAPPASSEPKTYANLVKSGTGSTLSFSSAINSTPAHSTGNFWPDGQVSLFCLNLFLGDGVIDTMQYCIKQLFNDFR